MVVGNGLVATAFKSSKYNFEECIIFASGVSNSKLEDKSEFQREFELIKKHLGTDKKFIYFSSIHMLDPSQNKSMYVQHKIEMESFIETNFDQYIIYRLPIIMGEGGNDKSLFNYLYHSIVDQTKMNIYVESYRYVMDVEDVVWFVNQTLDVNKKTINLVFNDPCNILEIIKAYEKVLNVDAQYDKHTGGDFFRVDNSILKENISKPDILDEYSKITYIEALIKKYYLKREVHVE